MARRCDFDALTRDAVAFKMKLPLETRVEVEVVT